MLTYVCDTCGHKYEASLNGNAIVYMDGNMRTVVRSEADACYTCQKKIDEAVTKAKEAIKNNGQQTE